MLPIDRTNKTALDANLVNGNTSDAPVIKSSNDVVYNTIDELNSKVEALISAGALSPYPPGQYNRLINGGFAVNQRGVSGTVTLAAGAYGHDRWKAGAAGCTYTFATVNNVTTITITAGSLLQVIEGVNLLSGNHTLSWAGTSQGKIGAGSYGTSGIKSAVTGGTNLSIEFNTGTLSKVQFNAGDAALPFQPRSFAEELQLCQRYYEKSYPYGTAPATAGIVAGIEIKAIPGTVPANTFYGKTSFKVKKRVAPTITIYPYTTPTNTGRVSEGNNGADFPANSGLLNNIGDDGFTLSNGTGATMTVTNGIFYHWASDAEL